MNNPEAPDEVGATSAHATLIGHFAELRRRVIIIVLAMVIASSISFVFVDEIYAFLTQPLANSMKEGDTQRLIYTGLTEGFFTYIKVALFTGVFVSFPFLLIQIWRFIAPGLYANERKTFFPFLMATPVLFFAGAACVYYVVMPTAWPFFLSFQTPGAADGLAIQLEARVSEYLDLIMTLIFAFGLCFQIPVLLTLLGRAGIISADTLVKGRKYAIVLVFVLAAFLTPPDIMSQVMLAIPILALYEVSIILIKLSTKGRASKSS
jgi:sec-independent protein translocase protein TatC